LALCGVYLKWQKSEELREKQEMVPKGTLLLTSASQKYEAPSICSISSCTEMSKRLSQLFFAGADEV
jgi:hypothetical protein